MAGSRFAYVRDFELPDPVLPSMYMVVRVDGRCFHKFSDAHQFVKPNDAVALELMNQSARHVCQEFKGEVIMAFGESDEYSFLLKKECSLHNRRQSKITTHIVSLFTSAYVFYWPQYFPTKRLLHPPSFDARLVQYPTSKEVRDYFSWRQADTHVNNLYNTVFWALVLRSQPQMTEAQAHQELKGTVSAQKNEILFSRFQINYDREAAIFRKGSTLVWTEEDEIQGGQSEANTPIETGEQAQGPPETGTIPCESNKRRRKRRLRTLHVDIISDDFWKEPKKSSLSRPLRFESDALATELQPWEDEERLQVSGLGRWALL